MMDKENQDLDLDQDFVADLGVPFICSNCNELFGSQEYLNQHSDMCHGIKLNFVPVTDHCTLQGKEFHDFQQDENMSSTSSLTLHSHDVKSSCFQQRHTSVSGTADTSLNLQEIYFSSFSSSPYSSFSEDSNKSSRVTFPESSQPSTEEISCLSLQRNDVLLSSTTESTPCFDQLPTSFSRLSSDPTLGSHLDHNSDQVDSTMQQPLQCSVCHNVYLSKWLLEQHSKQCIKRGPHRPNKLFGFTAERSESEQGSLPVQPAVTPSVTQPSSSVNSSNDENKVSTASSAFFTCSYCQKSFCQKAGLVAHIRTHTGEKPFSCEECGRKFSNKSNLKKHYRVHTHEKPYQCSFCGDSFSLRSGLTIHWRTHTGEKPFECVECGQRFSSNGNWKKHMRIHSGEQPFGCKVCGRRFPTNEDLRAHGMTHSGEKCFQCPMCDASFLHRGGLEAHFRTHSGEKPFPCDFCDLTFARRGGLKAHMRTHTGEKPYVCFLCSQAFAHKSNLNAHNRTHTGEKPFGCPSCDQKFAHKSNLKKHMNTHTGKSLASSPASSLSDSSSAVSDSSVTHTSVISAVTKMTSVMVSPFSNDNEMNFFDLLDMLEHPSSQALSQV